jgi:predicted SAM-dependent methyltransferase
LCIENIKQGRVKENMNFLNIGCGKNIHTDWVNIDFAPSHPSVIDYDLQKGVPFPDNTFDACYSSHLLEHLKRDKARLLCNEIWRVLKPGSFFRVVVPDLEALVKSYLDVLSKAKIDEPITEANYDWIMLELYDQTVRTYCGGEMGLFLSQENILNKDFILSRIGLGAEDYWHFMKSKPHSILEKIKRQNTKMLIRKLRLKLAEFFVLIIAGQQSRLAFQEGVFRLSGENHLWMYDRFSLSRLLMKSGFKNIEICDASTSQIPHFSQYSLDKKDDQVFHPDSIFMEGQKL